jgi:hypothetical protein
MQEFFLCKAAIEDIRALSLLLTHSGHLLSLIGVPASDPNGHYRLTIEIQVYFNTNSFSGLCWGKCAWQWSGEIGSRLLLFLRQFLVF